jgi:SAM-dependent methyltransferase
MAGQDVLDLGCSSGNWRDDWIHAQVSTVAHRLVGIDINAEAVKELQARGFDVRFGNAESFDVEETFDVVFGGELIEHLENPGGMLRSALRHLSPDGRLILTTPNVFAFSNFVYRLKGRARINGDHTCWYCEDTLTQMLNRVGYKVLDVKYLRYRTPGRFRGGMAAMVRMILPDRLAWSTLIVVASRCSTDSDVPHALEEASTTAQG